MKLLRRYPPDSSTPLVLTIGNFDGVHLGHRYLIAQVCRRARALPPHTQAAAMTFEPHPLTVLRPGQPLQRLGSRRDKLQQLQHSGLDLLYIMRFNQSLAAMPAADFADLLFSRLRVRHLFIGENFRFGSGGRGGLPLLQSAAAAAGADVTAAPLFCIDGAAVSSGRVRDSLQRAEFDMAEKLLGRPWRIYGKVMRGDKRGRQLGFPTANVHLSYIPPLRGIYAARACVHQRVYPAAVSIGVNPTVSSRDIVRVEAHLLGFNGGCLYGAKIDLQLLHKLRDEQQYNSLPALAAAIADDVAQTRVLVK